MDLGLIQLGIPGSNLDLPSKPDSLGLLLLLPDYQAGEIDVVLGNFTKVGEVLWYNYLFSILWMTLPPGMEFDFYCYCVPPTISLCLLLWQVASLPAEPTGKLQVKTALTQKDPDVTSIWDASHSTPVN